MAQLVALPKIAPLQGVDTEKLVIKTVSVPVQNPAKVYDVFKDEPYRLPQLSRNHVTSVTLVEGKWGEKDSEKAVVYYPGGNPIPPKTEWFKDNLVRAYESDDFKSVIFEALEGDLKKYYHQFYAGLDVPKQDPKLVKIYSAKWTIAYDPDRPDAEKYLDLLKKVTEDVDKNVSSTN